MMTTCAREGCSHVVVREPKAGRPAIYCSPSCKEIVKSKRRHAYRTSNMTTYLKNRIKSTRSRCTARNIPFEITTEYALRLFKDFSPERCPASGVKFRLDHPLFRPSLDRLDPSKGYVPGNCIWITWGINRMKSDYALIDVQQFIEEMKR